MITSSATWRANTSKALFAFVAFLNFPRTEMYGAEGLAASDQPAQKQADRVKNGPGRVTFNMRRERDEDPLRVEWSYPRHLARAFEAQPSEEARTAFGIAEMRKQEEAGDQISGFELGYFYLYGMGVSRDLMEAEARLRTGLELKRPEGAWRLAWQLALGDEAIRDLPKAGELVRGAVDGGCKDAIPTANHIAHYFISKAKPSNPSLGIAILDDVLELEPGNAYALVLGADARFRQKDFEGAWALATRVLGVPGVSAKDRARARSLRVAVAQRAGKVADLEAADLREPLAYLASKIPRAMFVLGVVSGAAATLMILVLLAFLTRRCGARGPGIILTGCWIGIPAVAFGFGLLSLSIAAPVGFAVVAAAVLALCRGLRGSFFPTGPLPSFRGFLWVALVVLGCAALIFGVGAGYGAVFKAVFGHPPDQQLVAVLLRADNLRGFAVLFFAAAICIPVVEEITFRGFLLDWLRRRLAWGWAITVGAIVFGLIHGPVAALPTAVIGVMTGWLRMRFGNLWVPILLHGLNNGVAVVLLWLEMS